jgi:hypothetical protein
MRAPRVNRMRESANLGATVSGLVDDVPDF